MSNGDKDGVCSTCLKYNFGLAPVTKLDYDDISYLDKLKACVSPDLVRESDNLQMCQPCIINLKFCYKFRGKVLKSLQKFNHSNSVRCSSENQFEDVIEITVLNPSDKNIISIPDTEYDPIKGDTIHDLIEQMKHEAIKFEDDVSCKECSKTFKTRKKLQQHISRIHDKNNLVCEFCGNKHKSPYHLKEHITSHTGEKNFNCIVCDKAFPRLSSLKRHMNSHYAPAGQKTKKKPFLCNICGKNFPFSNGAARHMRIHLGLRKHECHICPKKFTQSTHLQAHLRTHSKEKPYICENCGESFTLKAGLDKHLKSHQKNEESTHSENMVG